MGATWLVGLGAALLLVELLIGKSPLGAALLGAVVADVVAGFAGVRWDTDARGQPITKEGHASKSNEFDAADAIRRAALGAGVAIGAIAITLLIAAPLGWIRVEAGEPSKALGLSLVRGAALGVREELFLRGIALAAAARAGVPPRLGALFAALTGGAAIALVPGAGPSAVALAVGSGLLFATLWQWQRGAWAAVGAHGAWIFLVGGVIRGGVIDVEWTSGALGAGARSFGGPAWLAGAVCAAIAVGIRYATSRKQRATPSPPAPPAP